MRTTIDIDDPILQELKKLQKAEGKSLKRLVSDLLAQALELRRQGRKPPAEFAWTARPMSARVDLADRDAVYAVMERDGPGYPEPSE